MDDYRSVIFAINEIRDTNNISISDITKNGISRSSFYRIINGKSDPTLKQLISILKTYGMSMVEFFEYVSILSKQRLLSNGGKNNAR
jgi:DNA-binding phage protein